MKIFILAPETAGKTVFVTMLNAFVEANPHLGVTFAAADVGTKKYLHSRLEELRSGGWPRSSFEGRLGALSWKWNIGRRPVDVEAIDPSGQDIRKVFSGVSDELGILRKIDEADLLILLVDVHGHQGGDPDLRCENGFIVEQVVGRLRDSQHLILAVTKADLLTASLPVEKWGDRESVLSLLKDMMPEFSMSHYGPRFLSGRSTVMALSAVSSVESRSNTDGKLVRMPKSPLVSEGMDRMVSAILSAAKAVEIWKRIRQVQEILKEPGRRFLKQPPIMMAASFGAVCCACVMIGWIATTQCETCAGRGKFERSSKCAECKGKGSNRSFGCSRATRKCQTCNGTGKQTATTKCPTCKGWGRSFR